MDGHQSARGNSDLERAPFSEGLEVVNQQTPYGHDGIEASQKSYGYASSEAPQAYNVGSKENTPWQHQPPLQNGDNSLPSHQTGRGRPWVLILALACAATAIIVGAAVGGGVGASLASCRDDLDASRSISPANLRKSQCQPKSQSPTRTPPVSPSATSSSAAFETTTGGLILNYKAEPASKIANLSVDCDSLASSIQVTQAQEKFLVYCGVDFKEGPDWTNRDGSDVVLADLLILIAYSMADCLQACSQYTAKSQAWDRPSSCGSVTFKPNIGNFTNGNCWLKNSTVTHDPGDGVCDDCISATKIS